MSFSLLVKESKSEYTMFETGVAVVHRQGYQLGVRLTQLPQGTIYVYPTADDAAGGVSCMNKYPIPSLHTISQQH